MALCIALAIAPLTSPTWPTCMTCASLSLPTAAEVLWLHTGPGLTLIPMSAAKVLTGTS